MSQPGNGGPQAAETQPAKHRIGAGEHDRITAHYRVAVPLMTALFGGTPLVYAAYPEGLDRPRVWHGPLRSRPPIGVPTRDVPSTSGVQAYLTLSDSAMDWVTAHRSAVEFHGWGCTADDPARARFARIELELDAKNGDALIRAAMNVHDVLQKCELRAIPVLQGTHSIALWIPLGGGPLYPAVRAWLYALCARAVAEHPTTFSLQPNAHVAGRVHLHVGSNAPARHSALPYSLIGGDHLRACTPVTWDELPTFGNGASTAQQLPARLAAVGEVFAAQLAQIGDRSLPKPAPRLRLRPK